MTSARRARHTQPPSAAVPERSAAPPEGSFPSFRQIRDVRGPFLIPLLLLLAARITMWVLIPVAAEDAYISFRYARNLASGNGLVYNPGEHVLGFTSPLWTLWCAVGYRLFHDPIAWARSWSIAADVLTLLGMGGLLLRHASRRSAWCFTFFFAAWPYFAAVAVSGMETSLMLALLVLAALLLERRTLAGGPALAALALVRPEGLPAATLLALGARKRDAIVGAGIIAVALGALALYFGGFIPQSVTAKAHLYGTPGPWAGRHWWEWLSPFPLGRWPRLGDTAHLEVLVVVMAPACWAGARELWRARQTALARTVGAALVVWLGYVILGVTYFWWYLQVPLAGLTALAAIGLPSVVRGRAIPLALVLFVVGIWTIAPKLYLARSQEASQSFGGVADFLLTHGGPGQKVMLEPIGMIGYRVPMSVVDEIGLVSPGVTRRRLLGPGWYTDIVARERPDWSVVRVGVLRTGEAFAGAGAPFRDSAERDSLMARYPLVMQGDERSGDMALVVLERRR